MASGKYLSLCFRISEMGMIVPSFTFHEDDVREQYKRSQQPSQIDSVIPILGTRKLNLRQKHDFH